MAERWIQIDAGPERLVTKSPFLELSIAFILLPSRSGEEEGAERYGASLETDDRTWAVCNPTLEVVLSAAPASSIAACGAPRTDNLMKLLDNF